MRSTTVYIIVGAMASMTTASNFGEMGIEMNLARELGIVPRQSTSNLQTFTSSVGSKPVPITQSTDPKRPFQVGTDTFPAFKDAYSRSCDDQKNDCANVANSAAGKAQGLSVNKCDAQRTDCVNGIGDVTQQAFPTSSDGEFDFFCDP